MLSIIIPIYNVEKYLTKCIESILNDTYKDYEIILVNDGSKDNSQVIIDEYVKEYPDKIKAYIKENGGLSDARNYGITKASGEYITFIDSDDYIEKDYLYHAMNIIDKENPDLLISDLNYIWENSDKEMYQKGLSNRNVNPKKDIFLSPLFAWNKIYKKELFDKLNLRYPKGLWYEDIPVTLTFAVNTNKISYYSGLSVNYLQRDTSIMGSKYNDKMFDIFKIMDMVKDSLNKYNLYNEYKDELEYLAIEQLMWYGAFRFLRTDRYKDLLNKSFEYMNMNFPNYKHNKYLKDIDLKNKLFIKTNNRLTMKLWHMYLNRGSN